MPYDIWDEATKYDGVTGVLLWWGDWMYVVRHIAHFEVHTMVSYQMICNKCVVLLCKPLNDSIAEIGTLCHFRWVHKATT